MYQSGGKTDCSEIFNESNSVAYLSRGGGKFVKVRVSIDPVREGPVVRQGGRQTGESVDRTRTMAVMAAGELNDGAESRCSPVARMFHGHELVS